MSDSNYEYVLAIYGEEKVKYRFVFIRDKAYEFLRGVCRTFALDLYEFFSVNDSLIEEAVLDYFADLQRLKEFHNIEKAQPQKVAAYTSYWIFRRKPIQIIKDIDDDVLQKFTNIKFINEMFAYSLLQSLVFDAKQPIVGRNLDMFRRLMMYNFQYRQINAQILELVIIALNTDPGRELLAEIEDENVQ
ncbi:hypothetical protein EHQ91_10705 [Leptospira biflexa]|uniref:hypothetical protein n=1 Tax=Leptospira biflexa TaxID=172 RepID=UPI001090C5C6|nr:hypothetical protein [Leptospira biflexa]TGM55392.1 hypothetical protein EHQ91_10705 [Leptospira biflexa]